MAQQISEREAWRKLSVVVICTGIRRHGVGMDGGPYHECLNVLGLVDQLLLQRHEALGLLPRRRTFIVGKDGTRMRRPLYYPGAVGGLWSFWRMGRTGSLVVVEGQPLLVVHLAPLNPAINQTWLLEGV
jgi:hypothetical protein